MATLVDSIETNLLFSKSVNFDPIRVDGRRIVAGYANVADVIDAQNEKVTREALEKAWAKFSSNPKFCVSQLLHSNIPIASILLESIVDSDGVTHKSGVDERGLYIVAEVRSDIKIAESVWKQIQEGKIRGFSIGGEYLSPPVEECISGKCHSRVDDIELHEVSIVDNPANKVSLFNVLKSVESFSKLGELTSVLEDKIVVDGAVQVSKRPYSDGLYGVYIKTDFLITNETLKLPKEFKIVKEKCPQNEWVNLFDVALLRPYSLKGEDLTGSVPGGFKDASLLDKPKEEGSTLNTKNDNVENVVETKVDSQPEQTPITAPPVEEKRPLTLEILAADIARIFERLNTIPQPTIKSDKEDKDEEDEEKKKKRECEKVEKSAPTVNSVVEIKPTTTIPDNVTTLTTNPPPTPVVTVPEIKPVEIKPVVAEVKEAPPTPVEVKAPELVKPAIVSEAVIPTPPVIATETKVIMRGKASPKQEVDPSKVDLLRLHRTPWKRLFGDE